MILNLSILIILKTGVPVNESWVGIAEWMKEPLLHVVTKLSNATNGIVTRYEERENESSEQATGTWV